MIEFIAFVVAVTVLLVFAAGKLITQELAARIVQGVLLLVGAVALLVHGWIV